MEECPSMYLIDVEEHKKLKTNPFICLWKQIERLSNMEIEFNDIFQETNNLW